VAVAVAAAVGRKVLQLQLETATNKKSRSSVWLEHYTDNVGVSSSNLLGTTLERKAKSAKQKAGRFIGERRGKKL
jgi:hypothetical protein